MSLLLLSAFFFSNIKAVSFNSHCARRWKWHFCFLSCCQKKKSSANSSKKLFDTSHANWASVFAAVPITFFQLPLWRHSALTVLGLKFPHFSASQTVILTLVIHTYLFFLMLYFYSKCFIGLSVISIWCRSCW